MRRGDLVFCHGGGAVGRAIRLAQRLRFRSGAWYNHVAMLYNRTADGDWTLIQATGRGVTCTGLLSEAARRGQYRVVENPSPWPVNSVRFARGQVGRRYGFLTVASILTTLACPSFVNVMLPNTWICSALAAEALRCGGWIHSWPDVYQVSPAQLWEAV